MAVPRMPEVGTACVCGRGIVGGEGHQVNNLKLKKVEYTAKETLGVFVLLLLTPAVLLWQGYVLSCLFKWFVGFISLQPAVAAGLILIYRFFILRKADTKKINLFETLVDGVVMPGFGFGMGYILYQLVQLGW